MQRRCQPRLQALREASSLDPRRAFSIVCGLDIAEPPSTVDLAGSKWVVLPAVVAAVVAHEWAHGWVAQRIGGRAPEDGSSKPVLLPYVDLFGTLIVRSVCIALGGGYGFAWGRPAPVDHARLRDPRNGPAVVALAGPAANALGAIAWALVARGTPGPGWIHELATGGVFWNCAIAWFNLIPLPPLDGAWVLMRFLRLRHIVALHHASVPGFALLALLCVFPGPARSLILGPPGHVARLLLGAHG